MKLQSLYISVLISSVLEHMTLWPTVQIFYFLNYNPHKMVEQNSTSSPELPEQPHHSTTILNFPKKVYVK